MPKPARFLIFILALLLPQMALARIACDWLSENDFKEKIVKKSDLILAAKVVEIGGNNSVLRIRDNLDYLYLYANEDFFGDRGEQKNPFGTPEDIKKGNCESLHPLPTTFFPQDSIIKTKEHLNSSNTPKERENTHSPSEVALPPEPPQKTVTEKEFRKITTEIMEICRNSYANAIKKVPETKVEVLDVIYTTNDVKKGDYVTISELDSSPFAGYVGEKSILLLRRQHNSYVLTDNNNPRCIPSVISLSFRRPMTTTEDQEILEESIVNGGFKDPIPSKYPPMLTPSYGQFKKKYLTR